jgi:hypothetical protein
VEFIFEIALQFLGEILLQMFAEILAEIGFRSLEDTFKKQRNPVLSALGFALWGAMAGGVSLLIFPNSPISNIDLRILNLIITPLIAGGVMMLIGRARNKRGQSLVKLDRFGYAFAFAFAMAVIRFVWANDMESWSQW